MPDFAPVTSPRTYRPWIVLSISILAMLCICIIDLLTPADIRLHVLYVFPLAAIAYSCPAKWMPAFGFFISASAQLTTFYWQHFPRMSFITDTLVAIASSIMTIILARRLRASYIAIKLLADSDALTGLSNRRRFESIITLEISRQIRYGGTFSLIAIDLNDFKNLNDTEGHHAGDQALILLGKTLLAKTRQTDSVARLGGDEFAILLPNTSEDDSKTVSQQLTQDIEHAMAAAGFPITASVGCITFNHAPASSSTALQAADRAMYRTKTTRRSGAPRPSTSQN